jgi:hypothetical protein
MDPPCTTAITDTTITSEVDWQEERGVLCGNISNLQKDNARLEKEVAIFFFHPLWIANVWAVTR